MTVHQWTFSATATDTPFVVAVCGVCGRIRRQTAVNDRIVDLRGECPGEAQEPEQRAAQARFISG